jgi:hypothetical protein
MSLYGEPGCKTTIGSLAPKMSTCATVPVSVTALVDADGAGEGTGLGDAPATGTSAGPSAPPPPHAASKTDAIASNNPTIAKLARSVRAEPFK